MSAPTPAFDIIIYGATSFVGQIMLEYLAEYTSQQDAEPVKWAVAGRDEQKLLAVKAQNSLSHIEHIVADASDEAALNSMCAQTKVVISTVGPYALYGETLIKVCAESGTDYCDLTGEPQWIKAMLDKYEDVAKSSGARIINSAGFDSIPSDLGVYVLQQHALETTGKPAFQIKMRVRKIKGGASGGTIASMLNVVEEASKNPALRKLLVNPYVLCPAEHPYKQYQTNHKKAQFEEDTQMWIMPFIMAAINERIVHRSNALLGNRYGEHFLYDEAMSAKKGLQAWGITLGLGAFMVGASIKPIRNILAKHVLPKPGEGPSKEEQLAGMFDMRFYTTLDNGERAVVQVKGDRDPGYGSTAKMLTQAALCLAKDIPDVAGGFWTPAAALNDALIQRLALHAGVTVTILAS
ncbi:MAG: saccharopine dehydrogenase NADP-binding domain-containing protein [Glaciecola sp.]|nr:saccharopine dehydrogenase NADP-binding domain-containing protein [Glaciecola sp.]